MDTRNSLPDAPLLGGKLCVYCGIVRGDSKDHTPPKTLLRPPLPPNLITLPACKKCNRGFQFDESVVQAVLALISAHPDLVAASKIGATIRRGIERDKKLKTLIDHHRTPEGNYELTGEMWKSFERVFIKTVQGLFLGFYNRLVSKEKLKFIAVFDRRRYSIDAIVDAARPSPLRDITDEPLPEITPSGWVANKAIIFLKMKSLTSGEEQQRAFHMVRETPVDWFAFQPSIFTFGFVKQADGEAVCIIDLWDTLAVTVGAPWPGSRGPLRSGRNNPYSRDRRKR